MPNPYMSRPMPDPEATKKRRKRKTKRPSWAKGQDTINKNQRKQLEKVDY